VSPLDVSFLYMETRQPRCTWVSVALFDPPEAGPFDYDRLVELISTRIVLVPRNRQKVRCGAGHLANPVWVDDPDFDVNYHVPPQRAATTGAPSTRGDWSAAAGAFSSTATARSGRCISSKVSRCRMAIVTNHGAQQQRCRDEWIGTHARILIRNKKQEI